MNFNEPVLLIGNGPVDAGALALAAPICEKTVAADGGAHTALSVGLTLTATIGDMDSALTKNLPQTLGEIFEIFDQDTTDFEKCLNEIDAPLILGLGFLGGRLDHELAALHAVINSTTPVVLIGEVDLVFLLPQVFEIELAVGSRISFFPMGEVNGVKSTGLKWEISNLALAPDKKISTSNQVSAPFLSITNPNQPLLCILPREHLSAALKSFKL